MFTQMWHREELGFCSFMFPWPFERGIKNRIQLLLPVTMLKVQSKYNVLAPELWEQNFILPTEKPERELRYKEVWIKAGSSECLTWVQLLVCKQIPSPALVGFLTWDQCKVRRKYTSPPAWCLLTVWRGACRGKKLAASSIPAVTQLLEPGGGGRACCSSSRGAGRAAVPAPVSLDT